MKPYWRDLRDNDSPRAEGTGKAAAPGSPAERAAVRRG